MKPGDRITLLKVLAKRLAEMEWGELDLTLRQFKLPWSESWNSGDRYGYALYHLEEGKDDVLLALYEHFYSGQKFPGSPPFATEGSWESNRFRLFLCHIAQDKLLIASVKAGLRDSAIDGFLAHEDIEPTKEWISEIELALETCHALAAFLTPEFHKSNWTDQEIGYCIKRRVLIIPVRLGLDPYGFISRFQGLQGKEKSPEQIARGIFEVLARHDLTKAQMAVALVSQFEDSNTFRDAKSNMDLLDDVESWTPEMLSKLESSVQRNSQISGAFGVPDRIRSLVKRHGK